MARAASGQSARQRRGKTSDETLDAPAVRQRSRPGGRGRRGAPTASGRGPDTGSRLLKAARAELVAKDGQMEITAVAARAGLSAGLAYHYFGSRAGLLAAVVEDFYDRYDAAVIDLNPVPGGDWATRERRRLELMLEFFSREPIAPFILARLSAEPEVAAVEARRLQRHIEIGAANISLGQARGELPEGPDPNLLIGMVMGGLRHAFGRALAEPDAYPRDRLVEELWNFIAAAVRLDPSSHSSGSHS